MISKAVASHRPAPTRCVHCGRVCGTFKGGYAGVGGAALCHPNEKGRPDCYVMVTTHHHDLEECARCSQDPYQPLTEEELNQSFMDSLKRLEQHVLRASEQLEQRLGPAAGSAAEQLEQLQQHIGEEGAENGEPRP